MTCRLMGVDDIQAENQPTWPATQICQKPVESGLGGDEEGVDGGHEG